MIGTFMGNEFLGGFVRFSAVWARKTCVSCLGWLESGVGRAFFFGGGGMEGKR